ncbi:MAG: hypothetical protein ABIU05_00995 [Nitrospirales bacterium]
MRRASRFGKTVLVFIVALLVVDLLYGYTVGPPSNEYVQLGLHVFGVVLVFPLAAIFNAWRVRRIRSQTEQASCATVDGTDHYRDHLSPSATFRRR